MSYEPFKFSVFFFSTDNGYSLVSHGVLDRLEVTFNLGCLLRKRVVLYKYKLFSFIYSSTIKLFSLSQTELAAYLLSQIESLSPFDCLVGRFVFVQVFANSYLELF